MHAPPCGQAATPLIRARARAPREGHDVGLPIVVEIADHDGLWLVEGCQGRGSREATGAIAHQHGDRGLTGGRVDKIDVAILVEVAFFNLERDIARTRGRGEDRRTREARVRTRECRRRPCCLDEIVGRHRIRLIRRHPRLVGLIAVDRRRHR